MASIIVINVFEIAKKRQLISGFPKGLASDAKSEPQPRKDVYQETSKAPEIAPVKAP